MRPYPVTSHNLIKALERREVQFPISRRDLLCRMDGQSVRIDWDKEVPFNEHISKIELDYFETKGQFFAALNASHADLNKIVL